MIEDLTTNFTGALIEKVVQECYRELKIAKARAETSGRSASQSIGMISTDTVFLRSLRLLFRSLSVFFPFVVVSPTTTQSAAGTGSSSRSLESDSWLVVNEALLIKVISNICLHTTDGDVLRERISLELYRAVAREVQNVLAGPFFFLAARSKSGGSGVSVSNPRSPTSPVTTGSAGASASSSASSGPGPSSPGIASPTGGAAAMAAADDTDSVYGLVADPNWHAITVETRHGSVTHRFTLPRAVAMESVLYVLSQRMGLSFVVTLNSSKFKSWSVHS
jgi:hypothetical protein